MAIPPAVPPAANGPQQAATPPTEANNLIIAPLGVRFLALVVDSAVIVVLFAFVMFFAIQRGDVALPAPGVSATDYALSNPHYPNWVYIALSGLVFVYYTILEAIGGASIGKRAFGLRVLSDNGARASFAAIVIRNAIRIPESLVYYIPSLIVCLLSRQRKRIGDLAAKTVVVRTTPARLIAMPAPPPGQTPYSTAEAAFEPPAATDTSRPRPESAMNDQPADRLARALQTFEERLLTVNGAHEEYRRLSAIELQHLAAEGERDAGGEWRGGEGDAGGESAYSAEYAAAWYTLARAVQTLLAAQNELATASNGTRPEALFAQRAEKSYLLTKLSPYLNSDGDSGLYDAYRAIMRAEHEPR